MDKIFLRRQIISLGFLVFPWLVVLFLFGIKPGFLAGMFFISFSFFLSLVALFRIAKDCYARPRPLSFVLLILAIGNASLFSLWIFGFFAFFGLNPA
ncbi:MAG: hypothetical protein AAB417_00760 [Patescibacteria group bacterium]